MQHLDGTKGLTVIVAHDYQCPWSWTALFQAERLAEEFPQLSFEWRGYELLPDPNGWPEGRPNPSDRFLNLGRLDDIAEPRSWPTIVSSHKALVGAAFVQEQFTQYFNAFNRSVYESFWDRGEDISDTVRLAEIAEKTGIDPHAFCLSLKSETWESRVIPFKDPAYADGITHVTTFRFRGEQCAEAPYSTIKEMASRFLARYS